MLPLSPLSLVSPPSTDMISSVSTAPGTLGPDGAAVDDPLMETAKSFEAAFIAQMLTFSGLGEVMTSGEGQMASAFSSIFLEAMAEDMAENGAFGLADKLYSSLQSRAEDGQNQMIQGQLSGGLL